MDDEIELTELTDLEVVRQDAVKHPASGFPVLIMKAAKTDTAKAVNAVGGINEKPDIAGAEHILQELGKLVISEASEFVAGCWDEAADMQMLLEAISLMKWFRECEIDGDTDDGAMMKAAGFVFKAHRKFSSDERKSLASEGKALPDGSYPIPDEDALRRAAILAKSGHGDVAAAKRLIAKRAKELGVPNPLADHEETKKDAPEDVTPETGELTQESVAKMIEDRLAEVRKADEETIKGLKDELTALKDTPIPGNVSLAPPPGVQNTAARAELVSKASYLRSQVERTKNDREASLYYQGKLREAEAALAAL